MPLDSSTEREVRRIDEQLRRLQELPTDVAVMKRDLDDLKRDVAILTGKVEREAQTRLAEREKDQEGRKTSLRWTIGTLIACTTTVIAAVAVIVSAFGGA